jgi:hypothetical protein
LEQRVEVFQGAGVSTDIAVCSPTLVGREGVKARELPDELGGLCWRQRAEMQAV